MRTEAEIRRAIEHFTEAAQEPRGLTEMVPAMAVFNNDAILLRWVLGEENSFQTDVMEPLQSVQRPKAN